MGIKPINYVVDIEFWITNSPYPTYNHDVPSSLWNPLEMNPLESGMNSFGSGMDPLVSGIDPLGSGMDPLGSVSLSVLVSASVSLSVSASLSDKS